MADHATVFFCKGISYMLCYDDDIEKLPSPVRSNTGMKKLKPFEPVDYSEPTVNKSWVMRIVYKPVTTNFGRRPDDMVDRYVVITDEWLRRMSMQFESVFPAGLDDAHLLKSTDVEVLD